MCWLQSQVRESVLGSILCKDTWNPAPLSSYEAAGILLDLFDKMWEDFEGHRFITNENEDYPF